MFHGSESSNRSTPQDEYTWKALLINEESNNEADKYHHDEQRNKTTLNLSALVIYNGTIFIEETYITAVRVVKSMILILRVNYLKVRFQAAFTTVSMTWERQVKML